MIHLFQLFVIRRNIYGYERKYIPERFLPSPTPGKPINEDFIMPEAFNSRVAEVVSQAVKAHI